MHIVTNRVFVGSDWEQEFEARFRSRAGQIDKQPGFLRMLILKPLANGLPYVVHTEWENQDAFQKWVASEDFKLAHKNPLPQEAFTQDGSLEQHQVIISAESDV